MSGSQGPYDALIIGAGHNGLTCACYLASAGMRVRAPSGTAFSGRFAEAVGYRGYRDRGLALPRTVLDALLLNRARELGAVVEEGSRVTALRHAMDGRVTGVEVMDAGGRTRAVDAALVIGADGLRSVVSRRLGVAATRRAQRRLALVTHYVGIDGMTDSGGGGIGNPGVVIGIAGI